MLCMFFMFVNGEKLIPYFNLVFLLFFVVVVVVVVVVVFFSFFFFFWGKRDIKWV